MNCLYKDPEGYILPGDDLLISLRNRSQLYISMEEGILVMNNDFYNSNSIDYPIPISIRRIDYKYTNKPVTYYGIFIDNIPICSYGYLQNITECDMAEGGDDQWILKGNDEGLTIEGKGGCITIYKPGEWSETFKHGVRIESCDKKSEQIFQIKRGVV